MSGALATKRQSGSRPLSIGMFTYSTQPRGSVVHAAHVADALTASGCPVVLYALHKGGGFFRHASAAEIVLVPAAPGPSEGGTAALVAQRQHELAAFWAQHGRAHDLWHAQDCLTANALLALPRSAPLVRTVHHVERWDDPILADCQTRSVKGAALCLTVSETARRDVYDEFGVRSQVVGNGVDVARFTDVHPTHVRALHSRFARQAGPVVLAVGGIEERKNTVRLLRAFARLRVALPHAELWILGGASVLDHGRARAEFEAVRAALPPATAAAVQELGVLDERDVPALFQAADAIAMPSLTEGFGLVCLEALAAGTPLLASARAPFTEFLDDTCAVLVDPLSDDAIAAGLRAALSPSPARREAGRRRARAHTWSAVAARHRNAYERLLHARNALHREMA